MIDGILSAVAQRWWYSGIGFSCSNSWLWDEIMEDKEEVQL